MQAEQMGPRWLTGHPFSVLIDGEFNSCFSTVSQAEWIAVRRAHFLPDSDARRRVPLRFSVIDTRTGCVLAGSGVDEVRVAG